MRNPFKSLLSNKKEPETPLATDAERIAREVEINRLKAQNQQKVDEAVEQIRKVTALIEAEGISGVFFIATGADRRGRK